MIWAKLIKDDSKDGETETEKLQALDDSIDNLTKQWNNPLFRLLRWLWEVTEPDK